MEKKKIAFMSFVVAALIPAILILSSLFSLRATADAQVKSPRVVYQKKTELDFEGVQIEGELKSPGEFYFQHKPDEKMDSLVKRRKNFHKEMLRDAMFSK